MLPEAQRTSCAACSPPACDPPARPPACATALACSCAGRSHDPWAGCMHSPSAHPCQPTLCLRPAAPPLLQRRFDWAPGQYLNGRTYLFTATATNVAGTSDRSRPAVPVTTSRHAWGRGGWRGGGTIPVPAPLRRRPCSGGWHHHQMLMMCLCTALTCCGCCGLAPSPLVCLQDNPLCTHHPEREADGRRHPERRTLPADCPGLAWR